jgi:hypothetical protein
MESGDRTYRDQVDPTTADKRDRVIPASNLRRLPLDLSVAREQVPFKLRGDFLFADRRSTGMVDVRLNNTSEDPMPFAALDELADVPIEDVIITHAAQPGLVLNLWYGYRARFRANSQTITSIGSIVNPVSLSPEDARYFLFGDDETLDGEAFHSGSSAGAVAAQVSVVQLLNPAASGRICYIDALDFGDGTAADRFELRQLDAAVSGVGLINTGFNKNVGGAVGTMQLRAGANAAPGGAVLRNFLAPLNVHGRYDFKAPLRLVEGRGVAIISFTVNHAVVGGFEWREKTA